MKVIIHGAGGAMGRMVAECVARSFADASLAALVDPNGGEGCLPGLAAVTVPADAVVDFSHHSAAPALAAWCADRKIPLVVGTTAHTPEERAAIAAAAERIPVFFSANMSVGVAVLADLARRAAAAFPEAEIEIVEVHHDRKLDVPSGTALMLADALRTVRPEAGVLVGRHENGRRDPREIGIHSLRLGNEVGTHEIRIATGTETLTLRHRAEHRSLFAEGALTAAAFLQGKAPGLYGMQELLKG